LVFLCPVCRVENRQNAKFCRRCGRARLDLEQAGQASGSIESIASKVLTEHASVKEVDVPTSAVVASFEDESFEPLDETSPQCSACWAKLRLTDKFCFGCGEPQPERSLAHLKTCMQCQAILPLGANFCFSCGQEVNSSKRRNVRSPVELFTDENSEFFPRFEA
jgi:predicted amidophosphoribosyltransferase